MADIVAQNARPMRKRVFRCLVCKVKGKICAIKLPPDEKPLKTKGKATRGEV
jgi:hypothetical protein